jgi:hypothetical protein
MSNPTLKGETCARCGFRVPKLSLDKVTQKELCPSCLHYLEGRRAVLLGRSICGKPSEGTK